MLLRWRVLLPALWLGGLLTVALLATPAPFATLAKADAVRVAGRMLAHEATVSLLLGALVLMLERVSARRRHALGQGSQFSPGMLLALGCLACTVLGYHVVQPMIVAARLGQGSLGVPALHAASVAFYVVKVVLVAALAWCAARDLSPGPSS